MFYAMSLQRNTKTEEKMESGDRSAYIVSIENDDVGEQRMRDGGEGIETGTGTME